MIKTFNLFGSYAKEVETKSSDIGLLIISDKKDKNNLIQREIGALETMYDYKINQIVVSTNKKIGIDIETRSCEFRFLKKTKCKHFVF